MHLLHDDYVLEVIALEDGRVTINSYDTLVSSSGYKSVLSREESIATARAILKHFGESSE